MSNTPNKAVCFEYMLKGFLNWANSSQEASNDLSILKVLKLLFFTSAVKSSSLLLDDIFNKFVAMPYGHVESDVYNFIKNGLTYFTIDNQSTTPIPTKNLAELDNQIDLISKSEIDSSIKALQEKNSDLIKMSPFDLVNLSHSWYSWQYYFNKAKASGVKSYPIPSKAIKLEDKIFTLQSL